MVAKDSPGTTASPKVQVGEIDMSAPFQSVKDAVTLFGEGAFSGEKPTIRKARPHSAQRVLAKETQLHLAQKELNKLKDQLKNAETTKAQALVELDKAKQTVEDLTHKFKTVNKSRESAVKATEAAKNQVKQLEEAKDGTNTGTGGAWNQELEHARKQYMAAVAELDAAKQELRKISQQCEASLEAKASAVKREAEAGHAAKAYADRVGELSNEITTLQESIGQVKLETMQAQQEEAKIYAEKEALKQSYVTALEDSAKKLLALKNKIDPDITKNLEAQLAETVSEIGALQKEMDDTKASDIDSVRTVTSELDDAKESLHRVAEEESSLKNLVESMKLELESVKQEHSELKEKEAEMDSIAGNLHVKLRKIKSELEATLAEESKARVSSEEITTTLQQLSLESENARCEAKELNKQAEDLKTEAESTRIVLEEAEKKLWVALEEAEEAKAAEKRALDQIKILSDRANAARASTSESSAQITISREEFESLSRKVEESDKLAEMKVSAARAQVQAVKASENEAHKRLEATLKEIEDIKAATQEALKRAEMAEAAKKAVEGELRRLREREQKKAADAASRILAETERSLGSSPQYYPIQKPIPLEKSVETRQLERSRTSMPKKVLISSLSGLFHRKKNQVKGGSFLPGEKPV